MANYFFNDFMNLFLKFQNSLVLIAFFMETVGDTTKTHETNIVAR